MLAAWCFSDPTKLGEFQKGIDSIVNRWAQKLAAQFEEQTAKGYDRSVRAEEIHEVLVERRIGRSRRPSPRHVHVPENLSTAVSLINDLARLQLVPNHPETALLARLREMCEEIAPSARQALVEHILRTPLESRERFFLPPSQRPAPDGWGIVAEGVALSLVVDEMAKKGVTDWVRQVLDCLRGPLRALPPPPPLQARPEWHPAAHAPIRVVAAILATTPEGLLRRLGGCRYPPCWTNPHQCSRGLAPYFIDRSPGSSKGTCCPTHRSKSLT